MKRVVLIFGIVFLFMGCAPRVSHTFEKIDPNNPIIKHNHFTIMQPTPIKDEKWTRMNYYDNLVSIYTGLDHKKDKSVWINYSLKIQTYSGENERKGDKKFQYYSKEIEAIKNKDEQYLKQEYLEWITWQNRGIISAKYSNVNKYPAIEIDMYKKYMNTDKYSKQYWLYSYSKTGKLKVYVITISVDIDKPNADDPQLLVEYSFEDMLKRSQRSLDSFVASDEDF
jgi:hypothetical protein